MKAQIKLGRIFGVEIALHYSWFIIALVITLSLAQMCCNWFGLAPNSRFDEA